MSVRFWARSVESPKRSLSRTPKPSKQGFAISDMGLRPNNLRCNNSNRAWQRWSFAARMADTKSQASVGHDPDPLQKSNQDRIVRTQKLMSSAPRLGDDAGLVSPHES